MVGASVVVVVVASVVVVVVPPQGIVCVIEFVQVPVDVTVTCVAASSTLTLLPAVNSLFVAVDGVTLPTWEDIAWLRQQWGGPFMVKGVSRIDDAKRVVDLGATALSVSNHGGNNLDGTPAPIRALPAIADAVGSQIDVLLDGGVRRGSDVVKAMALGARAVMIGRAYLWGLAANGQAGVENVLDVIRGGIDSALLGLGKSHVNQLTRDDVVAPPDFFRKLGA